MRRKYWKEMFHNAQGLLSALGVALLFYAYHFPRIAPDKRLLSLGIALFYGLAVYSSVYLAYLLHWLVMSRLKRSWNAERLPMPTHIGLSLSGMSLGLFAGTAFEAWATKEKFEISDVAGAVFIGFFICMMFLFYHSYRREKEAGLKLQAAKAESDLHVLRNQMQPHFLFNSLNSLSALIESNPEHAGRMGQKLADLYRLILQNSKTPTSTLVSEFRVAELYLEVEQVRFGERLRYKLDLPEALRRAEAPSLLLQTLVENAVKHGIGASVEGGSIDVRARKVDSGIEIRVENGGEPLAAALRDGTGLKNSRERLELLYGKRHELVLRREDVRTVAVFTVPEEV